MRAVLRMLLADAVRRCRFFLAVVVFGGSAFIGGKLGDRSMREPAVLAVAAVLMVSLGAVLWWGDRQPPNK